MMGDIHEKTAEKYLTMIDEECRAFIRAEHGRLQRIIGAEYWEPREEKTYYFHCGAEGDILPADPYELSLDELAALPHFEMRVERLRTYSYLAFFQMYPRDSERLSLLAKLRSRLADGLPCAEEELEELDGGHADYLEWKLGSPVEVIMPETWRAESRADS